ncbi:unnamed protein product [Candida verbasci]|uniref:Serine hydrolase domain-containing protein n=1 Tax=Candida verbasci TaxID=1227364 RepID=A0A9W4XI30_9ASCO|nr:unnamed protein product [Candida verbasci]
MAPNSIENKYKGKILFLHGYTQSSSLFYAKTSALRKKLTKLGYKCIYLNGPYILQPNDLPSDDSLVKFGSDDKQDMIYRGWWIKPNKTNDSINLNKSIETINDYIKNQKIIPDEDLKIIEETEEEKKLPILGLIGFSQGASFGGIICHKFSKLFNTNSLKFVIFYSGFKLDTNEKSGNSGLKEYYPNEKEVEENNLRYLHVYGELDTVVDETRSLSLYNLTKSKSDLLKHPGGHFVPNSKLYIDQVTNWIQSLDIEKVKNDKKEEDIDSLLDMMNSFGKV